MHRIYFQGNAGDQLGRYDLGIPGSLRDIAPVAGKLTSGMHVTLHDDQQLEVEAILEFDDDSGRWMGVPLWATMRPLDVWALAGK